MAGGEPQAGAAAVAELGRRLALARSGLERLRGQREMVARARAAKAEELARLRAESGVLEQVALLLQETAQYAREQARRQVESLVTSSLQVVFGPAFRFRIEVAEQRGAAQAEFYVVSDLAGTPLETRPQEARGGGVVDVVALALRLAMLQIYRPRLEGPLVLDEPAKHVSDEYIQAVAQFLAEVSRAFDRQVLMVTHNPHLAATAGTVFQVDLRDGCSAVARVEGEAAPWPN